MQDKSAIIARVHAILAQELGLEPEEITPDLEYGSTAEWDSVGHMHMVAALEDEFDFTFEDDVISKITTLTLVEESILQQMAEP